MSCCFVPRNAHMEACFQHVMLDFHCFYNQHAVMPTVLHCSGNLLCCFATLSAKRLHCLHLIVSPSLDSVVDQIIY